MCWLNHLFPFVTLWMCDISHIFFVIQAKLSRLVEACSFFIVNGARSVFLNITGLAGGNEDETPSTGQWCPLLTKHLGCLYCSNARFSTQNTFTVKQSNGGLTRILAFDVSSILSAAHWCRCDCSSHILRKHNALAWMVLRIWSCEGLSDKINGFMLEMV